MQRRRILLGIILVFGLTLLLAPLFLVKAKSNLLQIVPSATPNATTVIVSTASASSGGAITPTPSQLTNDQVIELYKQAVEISQGTVNDVHSTVNLVVTVVGVVFTAIVLIVAIVTWSIGNTLTKSAEQLEKARDQIIKVQNDADARSIVLSSEQEKLRKQVQDSEKGATEALNVILKIDAMTKELAERNLEAFKLTQELTVKQNTLLEQINNTKTNIDEIRTEIKQIQQTQKLLKKPLTLLQIDDYEMQLVSGNPETKYNSMLSLIEMTARTDPLVRRKAVKALGILESYDERAAKRLKEIIRADSEQGVRKEAEVALKFIEAKKPKKTTRRKP